MVHSQKTSVRGFYLMTAQRRIFLAGLGVTSVVVGLYARLSSTRWSQKTRDLVEELSRCRSLPEKRIVNFAGLEKLPSPVARYLRFALKEGQPLIRSARLIQVGELRVSESQSSWKRFRAVQFASPQSPGFVWDAHISLLWGVPIRVRDAYVRGRGLGQVDALSLVTLARVEGNPELAAGALMRYLAEGVWFPSALLPAAGVAWTPIDEHKALATLTDGPTTVSLEFRFGESGEVTSVYTPARYREVGGQYELTPWEGTHRNYQEKQGMRIPTEGEVEWHLPSGRFPVWKGTIEAIEYDFA